MLAGVFLLSEGIVQAGDLVRVEGAAGTAETGIAERITLRVTQIRKYSGELVTVPNGSITKIGNWSRGSARAVVEILIPYGVDIGAASQAIQDAAAAWTAAHADRRAEPEIGGITDLRDMGIVLQCAVLVSPGQQFAIASELRQYILKALTARGITPGVISTPGISPAGPPRTT
jgi:moderate conductance mechanosensitive channel